MQDRPCGLINLATPRRGQPRSLKTEVEPTDPREQ